MANPEHVKILQQGVETWNRWRREHPEERPMLAAALLDDQTLPGAELSDADLRGAHLARANLRKADFSHADLRGSILFGADLRGVQFRCARLTDALLYDADCRDAGFHRTDLCRAMLDGASLSGAEFSSTELSGLDLRNVLVVPAVHSGPSSLATSTLRLSHGQIPDVFLKGCGLDDWEIAAAKLYDPNLSSSEVTDLWYEVYRIRASKPMMINNLFISYTHDDSAFVDALGEKLDAAGIRYWRDIHDATAGRLDRQIDRAMRLHPVVLLVLSERSVNKPWVEWEASKAQELERELREKGTPKDVLLPVALDDAWETCDWEGPLRQQIKKYNVLPFVGWEDPEVMERQFQKVLAGLPSYGPKGGGGRGKE